MVNTIDRKTLEKFVFVIIIMTFGVLSSGFELIKSGERGVKITFGKISDEVVQDGLNFKLPLIQEIKTYNCRVQKQRSKTYVFSSDDQKIRIECTLNYNIDPNKVVDVFKKYGSQKDLETALLQPTVIKELKDVIKQYKAEEIRTKHMQIDEKILDYIKRDMSRSNEPVNIQNFALTDIEFSPALEKEFEEKAIERQKQNTN